MRTVEPTLMKAPSTESDVILSVNGVSKRFCRDLKRSLLYGVQDIALELSGLREETRHLRPKEFWALDDVSFQLKRGQAVGLIGKNGSGKSTLLRIISGLIKPDAGSIEVIGRVAPLIALGAGFSPILSGRENIYANMSILGLSKAEIDDRLEEVIDFAEIGDAIDAPVQTYSSGMAARLGFACAIHTKPDILLIDEVLAVGDVKFRCKCYRMLNQLRQNGTAFVLVSHSANSVLAVCESAVYLSKGKLIATGEVDKIIQQYEQDLFFGEAEKTTSYMKIPPKPKEESMGLDITELSFRDAQGDRQTEIETSQPAALCIECFVHDPLDDLSIDVLIKDQLGEGEWMLRMNNLEDQQPIRLTPGRHEIQLQLPYCGLKPGIYTMKLSIRSDFLYYLDAVESCRLVVTSESSMTNCAFYQPRHWRVSHTNSEFGIRNSEL
jgi:lipopolysaccharide transport system ATP-binding protein